MIGQLDATKWMMEAAAEAQRALCLRAKCGAVIVSKGEVIGRGYNAPPLDNLADRTCTNTYQPSNKDKYDRTCCLHAEWRAILDALRTHPERLIGAELFFVRIDDAGKVKKSGLPYCTVCSRLALDSGIATFALWHEDGIRNYPTHEYNMLSYYYFHPTNV